MPLQNQTVHQFFNRILLVGLTQEGNVVSKVFRSLKFSDFVTTGLVKVGAGKRNGRRSVIGGSRICIGRKLITGVTGIGERGGL